MTLSQFEQVKKMEQKHNAVEIVGPYWPINARITTEYHSYGPTEDALVMTEIRGCEQQRHLDQQNSAVQVEVVYVIDTSGSMRNVISLVNSALKFICQSTPDKQKMSIITFNEEAVEYWKMTIMNGHAKQQLCNRQAIEAYGYTNISQGIYKGLSQFSPVPTNGSDKIQRILVLLSDGEATHGPRKCNEILQVCQRHPVFPAVQIHTIAMGTDVDQVLLSTLATETRGTMYLVKTADELPKVLGECLGAFMTLIASHVTVELESETSRLNTTTTTNPTESGSGSGSGSTERQMESCSTIASSIISNSQMEFKLGALYEGEQRNILVKVPAIVPSVVVRIRYMDAATGELCTLERRLIILRTLSSDALSNRHRDRDVAAQLLRVDGQRLFNECAHNNNTNGLAEFKQRIVADGLQDHLVAQCLLQDVDKLLEVFGDNDVEQSPQFELNLSQRSVSHNSGSNRRDYQLACVAAQTSLGSQTTPLRPIKLRRQMSEQCSQFSQQK